MLCSLTLLTVYGGCRLDDSYEYIYDHIGPLLVGMGIVENSTVRFGSRFCFYGSVLSRFPKRFINDISWIETTQWNAWLNLPELESS